ncbi:MAG: NADH-quinone oxidoreductase subunit N [Desulfobulbaceae bacterium]|nr:MAG: NADH-quinone oxidoreductase subunit N [Desulfobulbaceae bacterium]
MDTAPNFILTPLAPLAPELLLICLGLLLVVVDLFLGEKRHILPWLAALGTLTGLFLLGNGSGHFSDGLFGGMYILDAYSLFFKVICLIGVLFTVMLSVRYLDTEKMHQGEYYSLLVFAAVGMMVMVSAADMIVLYLGLELMALSVYCLVGLLKSDSRSNEAALKYFLMGAFSSGILLYGISLIYGMTGTTDLQLISQRLTELNLADNTLLFIALGMVLIAFSFKVAAAPFHMWAPDAYEGAPTPITAFMSVGPKAASFAVLGRILLSGFPELHVHWGPLIAGIALLTMATGNILAISQTNIKRMLAYSSIAHAGFALLGILATSNEGVSAIMNYMLIYAFMNMGAFAIIIMLNNRERRGEQLKDYRGLAQTNPVAAALMLIFMFSLTGIPPTAGFIGKFYLFLAAMNAGYTGTVIAAVILSAVSAYYYLRVVRYMYMYDSEKGEAVAMSPSLTAALIFAVIGVIGLGVAPGWVLEMASQSLPALAQ